MSTEQQRKMLECAAKACGYEGKYCEPQEEGPCLWILNPDFDDDSDSDDPIGWYWRPHTNPADTAEMCAKLGIGTRWYLLNDCVVCGPSYSNVTAYFKDHDNSRLRAWMFAATMYAAKIGGYTE